MTQCSNQNVFKLLIVERSLISNRGHHHTQIGALKSVFPQAEIHIVAGEGYDGFLGEAVGLIPDEYFKLSRLRAKRLHGSLRQRLRVSLKMLFSGDKQLNTSAYGQELLYTCSRLKISREDMIIVPTADLDSLESAVDVSKRLGEAAPIVALRFLSLTMGEHSPRFFESRLNAVVTDLPSNVKLFTETEEMAAFFGSRYRLPVTGGFFLPCSVGFAQDNHGVHRDCNTFRVGVLGAPRFEKGSRRIPSIIHSTAERCAAEGLHPTEFIVQGSTKDFAANGVYGGLADFTNDGSVRVEQVSDRLSPDEFKKMFESLDAVLLPYDVSVYGLQGSGVIQDAVLAEKVLIHSDGMAMKSFLSHGNALSAVTDQDFADAVVAAAKDPSQLADGVSLARHYYLERLKTLPISNYRNLQE
ncbi:hypothetical protein [uncultured Agrobacterium sp.]|uniref:hypothetical protein n=1 Tax=uncultured Agrobacterium sp. TaxID=157277 RepID=UPI0025D322C7|nr:hypothetical protein [uncultured Agrobacterium sp.]